MSVLTSGLTVSEGGLEPVERPLDKRVSDILSAKWIQEGPVARRSSGSVRSWSARKPRLILIPAQRVSPGCLTRAHSRGG